MSTFAKYIIVAFLVQIIIDSVSAQSVFISTNASGNLKCKPPKNRELFHDYIDAQQKNILQSDGKNDNLYTPSKDDEKNFLVTKAIVNDIDELQCNIELDSSLNGQQKVLYLRGIDYLLKFFITNTSSGKLNPLVLPEIISGFERCFQNDKNGLSIEPVIKYLSYDAAFSIAKADNVTFQNNPGVKSSQWIVILKYCTLHPEQTFSILKLNPDVPFADSLVRVLARKYTSQLYDYAAANNKFGNIIRNITDDIFIKTVVKMARSKSGQQYFPFLDNIVNGKISFEKIDSAKNDSLQYYKLLIQTRMDYVQRALNKDTAFEYKALIDRLERKAKADFVNVINGLHNEPAEFRFRSIQNLTAEELYYLAVSSDGSIYTSSFVKGIFPLMMKKINNKGDSLLISLRFDKYRKFIKMSAGFNMLSSFLSSFSNTGDADDLMRAFVGNLEKSDGLEDGADVADSYASIAETLKPVAAEMLRNIQNNYQKALAKNDKRGMAIYNILNKLFQSADTTLKIDLTKELGIPPVYEVPYDALTYEKEQIAIQLFIYGDKDGMGVFPGLINMFRNSNWKIDGSNNQWVTISAVNGKPVTLYMNRPLPEETDEDALAQEALCKYLEKNKIIPTVTINRGHSYNAPYTIEQMSPASKIVFMGSCGGYRSIHDILEIAPDAHIIGTKQIADAPVNNPFLKLICEKLRMGSNIEWIPFWGELGKMATDKIFEDYVPPHKNLGALFIKAYKIAMEKVEEDQ
jgi:hypothetical protein